MSWQCHGREQWEERNIGGVLQRSTETAGASVEVELYLSAVLWVLEQQLVLSNSYHSGHIKHNVHNFTLQKCLTGAQMSNIVFFFNSLLDWGGSIVWKLICWIKCHNVCDKYPTNGNLQCILSSFTNKISFSIAALNERLTQSDPSTSIQWCCSVLGRSAIWAGECIYSLVNLEQGCPESGPRHKCSPHRC